MANKDITKIRVPKKYKFDFLVQTAYIEGFVAGYCDANKFARKVFKEVGKKRK